MKRIQSYMPAVALALVLTAIPVLRPAQAQLQEHKPKCEMVYLRGYEISFNSGGTWGYEGIGLLNSDSSSGAPHFQGIVVSNGTITNQPIAFAQTMADLMDQGYTPMSIDLTSANAPQAVMVKGCTALNSRQVVQSLSK